MLIKQDERSEFVILSTDDVKKNLQVIIDREIPVRRKKQNGEFSFIPPKDFDNYLKNRDMDFYIDRRIFEQEIEKADSHNVVFSVMDSFETLPVQPTPAEKDLVFEQGLKNARSLNMNERIQSLFENNIKMKSMISSGARFNSGAIEETGKIFSSTLCINKTSLEENMTSPVDNELMGKLVNETYALVDNLITLMVAGKSSFRDLADLSGIQTGSGTLNHMNRMLVRFISFLFFYNSYFTKYSNEVKKFRAYFKDKYFKYYNKIFTDSQNISLEIVFKNGITPVTDRKMFIEYAMGSFMHDVGKFPEIHYHDGDESYDPRRAKRHVFDSYNMLLTADKFTWGIIGMGLLHHDYYGAAYGYQQIKTFTSKFPDRRAGQRGGDPVSTKYLISYNILDVGYGNSLSYFPNKILEILDVFDSMTDTDKKYRKNIFMPEQALEEIRSEFLEKKHLGVDPVLFNIFVDFLKTSGVVIDPAFISRVKI